MNYEIAQNNYDIKKRDLIQEAKSRYHDLQKSYQDVLNKEITLDLSIQSLKDAKSKLDTGIGTKFEVLEANAQLTRDKQFLNEKKIQHERIAVHLYICYRKKNGCQSKLWFGSAL